MKKILLLLIWIPLLVGCDDDDKPTGWIRYEYLDDARDYIYFKPGTWWVYKRVPGGELDTIKVTKGSVDTIMTVGGGNTIYSEIVTWSAVSRYDDYVYKFYKRTPEQDPILTDEHTTLYKQFFMAKSKPGSYLGETNLFSYPFTTNILNNGAPHTTELLSNISEADVNGKKYLDIKVFRISNDKTFIYDELGRSGGIVQYYWAPDVGIIKREHMTKNITWELVESQIIT
jgi:hypothetical protein